ncbi:MAG: metallophosphoesterase [Eubacterium sp.]|nr:metallophosphoesterase [Eubacterium sp.]
MKRLLVFSDSHGSIQGLLDVVNRHKEVDAIFHAGDIVGDDDRLRNATAKQVCIVRGNCDWGSSLPSQMVVTLGGKRIAICHGDRYVNYGGTDSLRYWGMENNADMIIFGHTHVPYLEQNSQMTILNPGSISRPRQEGHQETYAYVEIDGEEIRVEIRRGKDDKKIDIPIM